MKTNEDILISVIVPVFSVEQYLDECIESIIAQTHKNLEIILVDDGSPDNCPAMCDEWAKRDSRIRVVHKKNGGLSSARNAGLDVATGEYIGYVDSDDSIQPEMYETMLCAMIENNADIASSIRKKLDDDRELIPLSINEALNFYLDGKMPLSVWSKLYKASKFRDLRFVDGRNNEDVPYNIECFSKANKILLINQKFYNYRVNLNSITRTINEKFFDQIFMFDLHKDVLMSNPATADAAMRYEWRMMLAIAHVLRTTGKAKKFANEYKQCKKFVRRNSWRMLLHPKMRWTTKAKVLLNVI